METLQMVSLFKGVAQVSVYNGHSHHTVEKTIV